MKRFMCLVFLLFFLPIAGGAETLDISALEGDIQEAQMVEEPRNWYERPDGTDSRIFPDGSVLVTISATGDVTIGGDRRKKGKSVFDKQLEKEELGLSFPLSNAKGIFEADDLTLINFEGTLTDTKSATKNTYSFAAPPSSVEVLTSASVEAVSLENNHVMDHGNHGYQDTCNTLDSAGILRCGHLGPAVFETDTGVRIGLLAYQTFNGNYSRIYEIGRASCRERV